MKDLIMFFQPNTKQLHLIWSLIVITIVFLMQLFLLINGTVNSTDNRVAETLKTNAALLAAFLLMPHEQFLIILFIIYEIDKSDRFITFV